MEGSVTPNGTHISHAVNTRFGLGKFFKWIRMLSPPCRPVARRTPVVSMLSPNSGTLTKSGTPQEFPTVARGGSRPGQIPLIRAESTTELVRSNITRDKFEYKPIIFVVRVQPLMSSISSVLFSEEDKTVDAATMVNRHVME